jgi:SAM-dependent methyltransferase
VELALPDFPRLKSVRGLGISDSDIYAGKLERCFNYTNTFYHREPRFDLTAPDETHYGLYDFVICSDVLEHVTPPADRAMETLFRLLKPHGQLILTLPFSVDPSSIEHFPDLKDFGMSQVNGKTVLVKQKPDGGYEVFDNLVFHGGPGSTLEMRIFSEDDLKARLTAAGFPTVRVLTINSPQHGVTFAGPCSLPIIASKGAFLLEGPAISELVGQTSRTLAAVRSSKWLKLGRKIGRGPAL